MITKLMNFQEQWHWQDTVLLVAGLVFFVIIIVQIESDFIDW